MKTKNQRRTFKASPANKWTSTAQHNVSFTVNVLLLLSIDNVLFFQTFQRKSKRRIFGVLHQLYTTKTTNPQSGNHFQVIQFYVVVF